MKEDIKSKVYNALADIVFETNASEEEMNQAIEFFQIKFFEDDKE